jgi:hypothetical protein
MIKIKPKPIYILNNPTGLLTNFEVLKSMQVHSLKTWDCNTWRTYLRPQLICTPGPPRHPAPVAQICKLRILEMIHRVATEALLYPRLNIMEVQTQTGDIIVEPVQTEAKYDRMNDFSIVNFEILRRIIACQVA